MIKLTQKLISTTVLILLLFCSISAYAQNNRRVNGSVADSSNTAVKDANVMLINDKDTLHTTTDEYGNFSFTKVKSGSFLLGISALGYKVFKANYSFSDKKVLKLGELILKQDAQTLKEVVIQGKPNPVRVMQDTVEYNAGAYNVLEGDNVADLLKQLPGLDVDKDYNVRTMGKEMTKLRVNGKDFFTSNVKDFIARLPAGIVSKIQVIDDFGDEANFTGIKMGEPVKMLNIVTKPGMNNGKFGYVNLNSGTNDQVGGGGNINLWKDRRQSNGGLNYGTSNNGAGTAQSMQLNVSHSDQLNEKLNYGVNYNYGRNGNAFSNERVIETLNPAGIFYNKTFGDGETQNNSHHFGSNLNYRSKKIYLDGGIQVGYNDGENNSTSLNNQWGVIKQDLTNTIRSANRSPNVSASLNISKLMKKKGSSLSANFGISSSSSHSDQLISTNTLYYDKITQRLEKDSLLNRNLITDNNNQNFNFGFNYSIGLKKPKDTLATQRLSLNYKVSIGRSAGTVQTYVLDSLGKLPAFVDSLSTDFSSVFINQSMGLSYGYTNKKMRYSFGMNASPSLISNNYLHLGQKIRNNTLNYSPSVNLSRTLAKGKTLNLNYNGRNSNPAINQLRPIRNAENLQNTVIGNPNLKPSFSHGVSASYNYVNITTGASLQTGLSFNTVRNEIVNNVVLVADTLNSLKQETRYENTNGNYNANSNYMLNLPFKKNKYSVSYSGNFGVSNRAVFFNNKKEFGKGLNVSQRLNAIFNLKRVRAGAGISYNFSSNNNALNQNSIADVLGQVNGRVLYRSHNYSADMNGSLNFDKLTIETYMNYSLNKNRGEGLSDNFRDVQRLSLACSGVWRFKKTWHLNFSGTKSINSGYALANTNPFIINAGLSKKFFRDQSLSLNARGNDLLNQGNNLGRSVSGSSIIDQRTNQVTRVFTFGLSYNISRFGGKGFRVDPDW